MTTLSSTLQIAKSGLMTQQQAMNVTAPNIANASTEGYTRQRALLEAKVPIHLPVGVFGTGVTLEDVQRLGDHLLDSAYFRELSSALGHETRAQLLERVEGILGEPTELGLGASLDAFYSAWSELATNPGSSTLRSAVRQSAQNLTDTFGRISDGLDALRQETEARLEFGVGEASRLADEIAQLNRQITVHESDGSTAGDLRDARAVRLGALAELVPIKVVERDDGSVGVTVNGISIVDGAVSHELEVRGSGGLAEIAVVGRTNPLAVDGGEIGAMVDVLNVGIPTVRAGLDELAGALVTEVNAVHVTGTNPTGTTGILFFDPAGVTAASIVLSPDVIASEDAIAAGTGDGFGGYRAGANDVANVLAGLRDADVASLGRPIGEHYRGLVFNLGQEVRSSADAAQVHRSLSDQADVRRMELGGVSVDEELVRMIEFQTAYQASARVVTAVDEMLQTLLSV